MSNYKRVKPLPVATYRIVHIVRCNARETWHPQVLCLGFFWLPIVVDWDCGMSDMSPIYHGDTRKEAEDAIDRHKQEYLAAHVCKREIITEKA